jgi:hypothetical protein
MIDKTERISMPRTVMERGSSVGDWASWIRRGF